MTLYDAVCRCGVPRRFHARNRDGVGVGPVWGYPDSTCEAFREPREPVPYVEMERVDPEPTGLRSPAVKAIVFKEMDK